MTGITRLATATLMGLLGSPHCVAMCGGVVAMTCAALPLSGRSPLRAQLHYVLAYNAGRIASYTVAGGVAGLVGASLSSFGSVQSAQLALHLAASAILVAAGAHIAGVAPGLRWLERGGEFAWKHVAPFARRWVPVRTPAQALALGLVWGWMPCGLVYAALATAVSTGSLTSGAATMAAFGLGTLPMLVALGTVAAFVARLARQPWVRGVAGVLMMTLGVAQMAHAIDAGGGRANLCCPNHRAG